MSTGAKVAIGVGVLVLILRGPQIFRGIKGFFTSKPAPGVSPGAPPGGAPSSSSSSMPPV